MMDFFVCVYVPVRHSSRSLRFFFSFFGLGGHLQAGSVCGCGTGCGN